MTIKTMTKSTPCVLLLATFLFAGGVQAQSSDRPDPGMLPDHPLYFVKSMSEGIGTLFTFGDAAESKRALELSEKRLAEARALADRGKPEAAERAIERYRAQLERALTEADEARVKGKDRDEETLADLSEATSRHQTVLAEVYQKVPEQARPGILRAMEASRRGHAQAKKAKAAARGGRPDTPGRSGPGRRGPPDSAGSERPDGEERGHPGDRGRPDSVEAARPDTAGSR